MRGLYSCHLQKERKNRWKYWREDAGTDRAALTQPLLPAVSCAPARPAPRGSGPQVQVVPEAAGRQHNWHSMKQRFRRRQVAPHWLPLCVNRGVRKIQSPGTLCGGKRGSPGQKVWFPGWLWAFSAPETTGISPQGKNANAQRTQSRLMPGIQASKSFCAHTHLTCTVRPGLSLLIYKRGLL